MIHTFKQSQSREHLKNTWRTASRIEYTFWFKVYSLPQLCNFSALKGPRARKWQNCHFSSIFPCWSKTQNCTNQAKKRRKKLIYTRNKNRKDDITSENERTSLTLKRTRIALLKQDAWLMLISHCFTRMDDETLKAKFETINGTFVKWRRLNSREITIAGALGNPSVPSTMAPSTPISRLLPSFPLHTSILQLPPSYFFSSLLSKYVASHTHTQNIKSRNTNDRIFANITIWD